MSVRIPMPPGCYGVKTLDGREYNRTPGSTVVMEDHHAAQIAGSAAGINGILSAQRLTAIGTRRGKVCTNQECRRVWQVWTTTCHRCGAPTEDSEAQHNGPVRT